MAESHRFGGPGTGPDCGWCDSVAVMFKSTGRRSGWSHLEGTATGISRRTRRFANVATLSYRRHRGRLVSDNPGGQAGWSEVTVTTSSRAHPRTS